MDELNQRLKKKFNYNVQYDIILDSPWENPDDTLESLAFVSKLKGYDDLDIFSLRLFPGTRLFQKALDEGMFKGKDIEEECRRIYRKLKPTYENFLFLLVRDNFLYEGWTLKIATLPVVLTFMRKVFRRSGEGIFKVYAGKIFSRIIALKKKAHKLGNIIKTFGIKKTAKIVKDKIKNRLRRS